MKKFVKIILLSFTFAIMIFPFIKVNAADITIDNVITHMQNNNILTEKEYFQLFGRILNGNNEYDIDSFKYTITKDEDVITIKVTLNDKTEGKIEKETILKIVDNKITYINQHEKESLESRIDTILFTQLIYSIGGARGYNEDVLVNWMNQINLEELNEDTGIVGSTEIVKYSYKVDDVPYNYTLSVPKEYTIDINKITTNIPVANYVKIEEVEKTTTTITLKVYAETDEDKECEIYRLNDERYEKIGTTSCNNGEFTDTNLTDNTTYTYQATVKDKIVCSDTKAITTIEIPKTGAHIYIGTMIVFCGLGAILFFVYKKNNLVKKV